ncbi:DNA-binding helix-turn-helix protein [Fructobacillus fructosus]|uniref:helix-turn-helix domain-containing protein n=1 Tax=Fructobacillus fructosus TaxID=1631 RepID=UPI0002195280|nr:helix-turn-helix transcriptional regulator [Fructobacillus fructosus]KRN52068.1 prophage lsa1 XRE family DNA-binding protein [Fructobacillus fructosus KCTC 3544]GAP01802.1 DNA-binding helix-turn-helix protein [Fructobacillus fructosus]
MTNNLSKLRKEKGLSMMAMAKELVEDGYFDKISDATISNYENGKREPKLATWQKLADFFGVSVAYLQGLTNSKYQDASYNSDVDFFAKKPSELDFIDIFNRTFPDRFESDEEVKLSFGKIVYTTHSRIRKVMPPMYSEHKLNRYKIAFDMVVNSLNLIDVTITDNELSNFIFNMRAFLDILEEDSLNNLK